MLEHIQAIAVNAATEGGAILKQYFETDLVVQFKEDRSVVTKADEECECAIRTIIHTTFPTHSILGEEGGEDLRDSEFTWIIDPLDGTANFINGIPIFAVSIAVALRGEPVVAVVYNPITQSLYSTRKGTGVYWNTRSVHISENTTETAMISFGQSTMQQDRDTVKRMMVNADRYVKRFRHLGCASLELAYVARGGTEGYLNLGTKLWDYAAGQLLLREAGGMVTDLTGRPCGFEEPYFVASNGHIHTALIQLVRDTRI